METQRYLFTYWLEEVVRRFGGKPAIEYGTGKSGLTAAVTYAELWRRAQSLAGDLLEAGFQPGDIAGLMVLRSPDYVIGFAGIWLAGGVVLPLEPETPKGRFELIMKEAGPKVMIVEEGVQCSHAPTFTVPQSSYAKRSTPVLRTPVDEDAPAYLIYTSGSSGKPKATLVSHAGLCPMLFAQIQCFQMDESSRSLWIHGLAFDASISDFGTTLLAGGTLCIAPGADATLDPAMLVSVLRRYQITHLDIPPALLRYLAPEQMPGSLQTVIIGGEACPSATVRDCASRVRLVNVYGPTEATVCTSMAVCDSAWERPLIGDPIAGLRYSILNTDGEPIGMNVPGELCISGCGVALGYPFEPEMTKSRFQFEGGQRSYRTGDCVVQRQEGIEFLGRIDRQFKMHGRLICPEEVESAITEHSAVRGCFVCKLATQDRSVLACCVEADEVISADSLRPTLARRIPEWMIPSRWRFVTALPRLSNGKPDAPGIQALFGTKKQEHRIPSLRMSDHEAVIADLFRKCLGISEVGPGDDFFELGGDSLAVAALLALAASRQFPLSYRAICEGRTVAGIASVLERCSESEERMSVEALRERLTDCWETFAQQPRSRTKSTTSGTNGILITGATGYLGSAVLLELLQQPDQPKQEVICLVRGPEDRARRRIVRHFQGLGCSLAAEEGLSRCKLISGDLAQERLGLDEAAWDQLAGGIAAVFHIAADIRHFRSYAELAETNVHGTRRILELCQSGAEKRLHYASTLSVFVDTDPVPSICSEGDRREEIACAYGGYAQTKWVAEQLVLRAVRERGQLASIYRFGLLTPQSETGYAADADWFFRAVREIAGMGGGCVDDLKSRNLAFDMTPIDYAARAMAAIARRETNGIYHIANETPVRYSELVAACNEITSRAEVHHAPVPALATRRVQCGDDFVRSLDLFKATGTRFDSTQARSALADAGLRFPSISRDYLRLCVEKALSYSPESCLSACL